jgi:hypothetical protein
MAHILDKILNQEQLQADILRVAQQNKEQRDADLRKEYTEDLSSQSKEAKLAQAIDKLTRKDTMKMRIELDRQEMLKEENARLLKEKRARQKQLEAMIAEF